MIELNQSYIDYMNIFIDNIINGYLININSNNNTNKDLYISIPRTKLVIGHANVWANNEKNLFIWPEEIALSYEQLKNNNIHPCGYMFWDIADEGNEVIDRFNNSKPLCIWLKD